MKRTSFSIANLSVSFLLALLASSCELPAQVQVSSSSIEVAGLDPGKSVCNPFGDAQAPGRTNGLWGKLFYLTPEMPRFDHVADYQTHGMKAELDLFFNQLNVPTRAFDQGFVAQDGTVLKTPAGDTLYEWFSIHLESVVQLSRLDRPGRYQFALLSDDGSVLKINPNDQGFESWIESDGITSSRLACATTAVQMDNSTRLPIQVDYFQGPRYHIALMLLWRELPDAITEEDLVDPSCGKSGNATFFNSKQIPSAPTAEWLGMLDRGWKVLTPENFLLPDSVTENPCHYPGGQGGVIGL